MIAKAKVKWQQTKQRTKSEITCRSDMGVAMAIAKAMTMTILATSKRDGMKAKAVVAKQ